MGNTQKAHLFLLLGFALFFILAAQPSPPVSPKPNECEDGLYYCPEHQTCCCGVDFYGMCLVHGCCPLENGVCCEGSNLCCPTDFPFCDVLEGTCHKVWLNLHFSLLPSIFLIFNSLLIRFSNLSPFYRTMETKLELLQGREEWPSSSYHGVVVVLKE